MPDILFKVLSADGRSCHGGNLQWPLPTRSPDGSWTPGEAVTVTGEIEPCKNGIHLATARQVVERWQGARVWVAQWQGEIVNAGGKYVVRTARLLHPTAWDNRIARHFAADCAERALQWAKKTDPRSWAAIRAVRLFADAKIDSAALEVARLAAYAYVADADAAADAAVYAAADAAAYAVADAAAYAAADAAAGEGASNKERQWQTERFLYYLRGGQPPCSD